MMQTTSVYRLQEVAPTFDGVRESVTTANNIQMPVINVTIRGRRR